MVCPLPQNYSSPMDYQYYLVVTLKWYETTQGVPLPPLPPPPPQKKRQFRTSPQHTQKKQKQKTQGPREKMGKKKRKKEGAIFANPPSEDPLVDEPLWEKARKAWPTAAIHNEIFEFSEIYICQKY